MPKKVGNVEIHMGPTQIGAPDDLESAIVGFVNGAKKRLDIAVQELNSDPIARAIVNARMGGVIVRLVTEMDYLRAAKPARNPFTPSGSHEVNRQIQNIILRSAIPVYTDFNPGIFHQKFMIRDGSAVLTGSTNFTNTGTSVNLNHVIIVHDRKVANTYANEFREVRNGRFGRRSEGLGEAPREVQVGNVPIKILFGPDHNPEMEIMKQMVKARQRIDFAVFTFAKSSGIDDVMVRLFEGGTPIRGVFDGLQASQKWAATKLVKAAGIRTKGHRWGWQAPSQVDGFRRTGDHRGQLQLHSACQPHERREHTCNRRSGYYLSGHPQRPEEARQVRAGRDRAYRRQSCFEIAVGRPRESLH